MNYSSAVAESIHGWDSDRERTILLLNNEIQLVLGSLATLLLFLNFILLIYRQYCALFHQHLNEA